MQSFLNKYFSLLCVSTVAVWVNYSLHILVLSFAYLSTDHRLILAVIYCCSVGEGFICFLTNVT